MSLLSAMLIPAQNIVKSKHEIFTTYSKMNFKQCCKVGMLDFTNADSDDTVKSENTNIFITSTNYIYVHRFLTLLILSSEQ